jgi:preprotein translocase subunit YajC
LTAFDILAATTQPSNPLGPLGSFMPLIILGVVMYFMLFLPKRRQDKQRQQMLETMKKGDRVRTIGGILGNIVEARPDRVLLKVDETSNTKIWFERSAIARVIEDGKPETK